MKNIQPHRLPALGFIGIGLAGYLIVTGLHDSLAVWITTVPGGVTIDYWLDGYERTMSLLISIAAALGIGWYILTYRIFAVETKGQTGKREYWWGLAIFLAIVIGISFWFYEPPIAAFWKATIVLRVIIPLAVFFFSTVLLTPTSHMYSVPLGRSIRH